MIVAVEVIILIAAVVAIAVTVITVVVAIASIAGTVGLKSVANAVVVAIAIAITVANEVVVAIAIVNAVVVEAANEVWPSMVYCSCSLHGCSSVFALLPLQVWSPLLLTSCESLQGIHNELQL